MPSTPARPPAPIHPALAAGSGLLLAGLAAWAWLGDWRWAVTGLVLFLAAAVLAATHPRVEPK